MSEQPSQEEIRRVRRWECSKQGHSWDIIQTFGKGPVALICSRCGEARDVVKPKNRSAK